jgi:RNA polymerase sigma-70 factor (ECF subfamily)
MSEVRGEATVARLAHFAQRLERRLPASYRLAALILGDRSDAEDATHEAVVAAWTRAATLRDLEAFDAWFDRILVNGCRDRLRRGRGLRLVDLEAADDVPSPDRMNTLGERDLVEWAFLRLNSDQRVAVVLRFWADRSVEEIASLTGARPGTVKSRLHYALRAMRDALDADSVLAVADDAIGGRR